MPGAREKAARAKTRRTAAEIAAELEAAPARSHGPSEFAFEYKPASGRPADPFLPGHSGNPGGLRPQTVPAVAEPVDETNGRVIRAGVHIPTLAREYCAEAIGTLVSVMRNGLLDTDRIRAAALILDRGLGKSPAVVAHLNGRDAADYTDDELLAIIDGRGTDKTVQ